MLAVKTVEGRVLGNQGAEGGKTLEQVGPIGDRTQGLPQEHGLNDLGKTEGGNGQVIALEPEDRQTDEPGEDGRQQSGQHQGHRNGQAEADDAVIVLIDLLLGLYGDGEDGVGIGADEHEARLTKREQARKPVEQVHRDRHQSVDGTLFEYGKEHMSAGQDQIQNVEERDADQGGRHGNPDMILFFHGSHLKPCRWPSHRRVRWAWR